MRPPSPPPGPLIGRRRLDRVQDRRWWTPSGPFTGGRAVPSLALGWSHAPGAQRSQVVLTYLRVVLSGKAEGLTEHARLAARTARNLTMLGLVRDRRPGL